MTIYNHTTRALKSTYPVRCMAIMPSYMSGMTGVSFNYEAIIEIFANESLHVQYQGQPVLTYPYSFFPSLDLKLKHENTDSPRVA